MKVKPQLNKVTNVLLFYLRIFGMWPSDRPTLLYKIFGYTLILIFSFIFSTSMVIQLFNLKDMKNSTEALYMTLTEVALVVKIVNFVRRIVELQQMLRSSQNFVLENEEELNLLKKYVKRFFIIALFYYLAAFYASSSADVAAAFGKVNELPFSAWYPYFDWKNSNRDFWILFTYQAVGMFITAMINVTVELFASLLMFMVSFKMEVLGMRLSKVGYYPTDPKNENEKDRFNTKELNDIHSRLVEYAKFHQNIISYKDRIENNFSAAYLAQVSISGFVFCCIANELAGSKPFGEKIVFIGMIPGMCLQILLPCYSANEILITSDTISTFLYSSNWIKFPTKHRKLIIIMMERLKRSSYITVGLLFPLTLLTFSRIINFAYRLFALLQNM